MWTPRRVIAAAAVLALCGIVTETSGAPEPGKGTPEPALIAAFETLRNAFRSGQTSPLASMLPLDRKIYLGVKVVASESGFYSRDQFEALLKQAFATTKTIKFDINMDLDPDRSDDIPVVVCPAAWIYLNRGIRSEISLRFLLAFQQGRWMLGEIRETR
jgi:hypothetical protein